MSPFQLPQVPGISPGIPFPAYLKMPGMSASRLKKIMRSPWAYKWALDHPDDDDSTKSKDLGTAAHTAILEPHRLKDEFIVWEADRRGKAWLDFREANADRQILTTPEWDAVTAMRDAVRGFPPAARYLKQGIAEVTIQWTDPATGRLMKGRVDWVTRVDGQIVLVDLKSTRSIIPRWFGADAYRLGYHIQFSLYTDGWFHLTRETPRFVCIAAENKEPYEPAVFDVTEDVLTLGHEEYMGLLATLKECEETGIWPPMEPEEIPLPIPAWALSSDDEDLSDLGLDLSV